MSNDKNHSEQFERYLKGQMSPEEAHAFEREVLDDPFAQEALEGYESQGANAVHDLEQIRSRIQGKQKNTWPWMRIAAVVTLLIVGSLTVYFFTDQIEGEQLAMEEESIEELTQSGPDPDTISIRSNEKQVSEETQIDTFEKDGLKVTDEDEDIVQLAEENNDSESGVGESEIAEITLDKALKGTEPLEGQGDAVQLAEVEDMEEVVIEPIADEMIVMKEEVSVPIQSFSTKKKEAREKVGADQPVAARSAARSSGATISEKDDQEVVEITPPKPSIGDSLYQEYLKQELIYPEAAQENGIEGEVILKLTIGTSGEIIDIKIDNSLGYGCDEEAIRLVKEGPKWNTATANGVRVLDTVRVNIQFNPPR